MNRSLDFVFTMMIISYFIDFFHFFDFLPFSLFADAAVFVSREKNKWRENSKLLFVMYFKIGQNEQI